MDALEEKRAEHVLVCISASPTNRKIIEEASELAAAFHADFTALYVGGSQEGRLGAEDKERLQANIRFAEDRGATITTLTGGSVPFQIAEFASLSGVTKIVIGRSNTARYHFWERQTLTDQLISIVPNTDIYIIPDSRIEIKADNGRRLTGEMIPSSGDLALTALLLISVTVMGLVFRRLGFTEANIITVYILGVLINAVLAKSHICSLISSFCSVLLFNYFFTEPRLTFHAYEPGYYVTFIIMLIAAVLTGSLAHRLKENARESAQAAYRTKVLFDTNRMLQKSRTKEDVMKVAAGQITLLLDRNVVIYPTENGRLEKGYSYPGEGNTKNVFPVKESEREVLEWVLANKKRAGATTKVFPKAERLYLAIRINETVYGIVGIKGKKILGSFEYSIVLSILGECALALENLKNEEAKEEAAVIAQNEKLRANLLRTVSHDLRTPLTSISGNASNLLSHYDMLDKETREQMFSDIRDEAEWLIRLVENLLSVTRMENNEIKLNLTTEVIEDVIDEAMAHIDRKKEEHDIKVIRSGELVMAEMDAKLIMQVIINIVNNAINYTPSGSAIVIEYGIRGDRVYMTVADNGPGMDGEVKKHAFDMFYTGQNRIADGRKSMGLGLALCRSVVEAHGGKIEIKDNEPTGCVFSFDLKKGDVSINE